MKFFFDFVACYGSCSSGDRPPGEETRLLIVQEHRRCSRRKRGRVRGSHEWRPSLSSISEDNVLMAERVSNIERPVAGWRRSLKRKVSSTSQRDRNRTRSLDHDDDARQASLSTFMPAFSTTPFMF